MSGLIGSIGAKSGILGTTELDYEKGAWTPVPNAGSFNTNHNRYIKIGGMCWLESYVNDIVSGGFGSLSGLPFPTSPTGTAYENITGTVMGHQVDWHNDTVNIGLYIYNNNITFFQTLDGGSWTSISSWPTNSDIFISCHYMCEK